MTGRRVWHCWLTSVVAVPALTSGASVNHVTELVDWLRSKGGTFSSKLEIRTVDPTSTQKSSRLGIFAKGDIEESETLFSVPRECLIHSDTIKEKKSECHIQVGDHIEANYLGEGDWYPGTVQAENPDGTFFVEYDDSDVEDNVEPHRIRPPHRKSGAMDCLTVENLIREMKLGNDSVYSAYVNYLLTQEYGQLPSAWSDAGKSLLMEILGRRDRELSDGLIPDSHRNILPPESAVVWLDEAFYTTCKGKHDPFDENAALMVVQRGWDDVLVPVYDMISHRNGRWLNSDVFANGGTVEVKASRKITTGEEIYMSYNMCNDCGGRKSHYGTPEILRDYGFVEQYPQRWFFDAIGLGFEIDEVYTEDGSGTGELNFSFLVNGESQQSMPYYAAGNVNNILTYLQEQLQRLQHIKELELDPPNDAIPKNEGDVIRQYHEALVVAMTHAVKAVAGDSSEVCNQEDGTCSAFYQRYDELEEQEDHVTRDSETCDVDRTFAFTGYEIIDRPYSPYQDMFFFQSPETLDTCFRLDGIVQICSSYRPHYHEMVVHNTARFLKDIRRVVWVGGGDSMLLHEIVKYPNLELAVGLELDQKVTRNSFKHFGTEPRYDNDNIQWWYGDATKSLLMLPEEYFGSFDLVLVDLSETVMSFKVTEELDVLEALSLLLKPEGIFVKNEMYLEKLSEIFDYTYQIHFYDCPVVCSQCLILGSNKVNFLHRELTEHNVETLFVKPLDEISDRYEVVHDFRKRDIRKYCNEKEEQIKEPETQENSPGIIMIVEAEDVSAPLRPPSKVKELLTKALNGAKLHVVSIVLHEPDGEKGMAVVVLQEGYVVARTWPDNHYCAFDIHLWSAFEKHEDIKKALINTFKANIVSSSSYRIVAGGMFGVSTWKEDEKNRGPRVTQLCDPMDETKRSIPTEQAAIDTVVDESMALVHDEGILAVVVCGKASDPCSHLDRMKKISKVRNVIALWSCPDVESNAGLQFECEKATLKKLKGAMTEEKKVRVLVIDPIASFSMVQIMHSIFSSQMNKQRFLASDVMVLATTTNSNETWRRNFLERFRRDVVRWEPVFRSEVLFNSSDSSMEMGVVSSGDILFIEHLNAVVAEIESRTGLESDVREIQGGLWTFQDLFTPTQFFKPSDYDQTAPLKQWKSQQPLGLQTVFQIELQRSSGSVTSDQVKGGVQNALGAIESEGAADAVVEEFTSLGEGSVFSAFWMEGNVVVLWDGRAHIDINLFTYKDSVDLASAFETSFMSFNKGLKRILRDEQPRGYGRVVNFLHDVEPRVEPHWTLQAPAG